MPVEHHETSAMIPPKVQNHRRAIASLIEELEAVAWYHERASVSDDESLRAILEHNRDEEIEHAAMLLEWLRRELPGMDEELKTYLFTEQDITEVEEEG